MSSTEKEQDEISTDMDSGTSKNYFHRLIKVFNPKFLEGYPNQLKLKGIWKAQ